MTENNSPWGVVSSIAKKDGVQGVLLLILCALVYSGQREAREERKAFQLAMDKAQGQVVEAHGKTVEVATQSAAALSAMTMALADNTRVLNQVRRRLPSGPRDDG